MYTVIVAKIVHKWSVGNLCQCSVYVTEPIILILVINKECLTEHALYLCGSAFCMLYLIITGIISSLVVNFHVQCNLMFMILP